MTTEPLPSDLDSIVVLTGLYPSDMHCDLVMHDFNQNFVVARVLKPQRMPQVGTLLPVLVRVQHISDDIKSRIHRRFDSDQMTTFSINGKRFSGKFVQVEYRVEAGVGEDADLCDVMTFVIECKKQQ